jgi:hypothetical protein
LNDKRKQSFHDVPWKNFHEGTPCAPHRNLAQNAGRD